MNPKIQCNPNLCLCWQIELDEEAIAENEATTAEIRECCQDIKVLGRKEIRQVP